MKKILTLSLVFVLLLIPIYALASCDGCSSAEIEVVTLANTPSDLVQDKSATTDEEIVLRWSANGNPSDTRYTLEYSTDNVNWFTAIDKEIDVLTGNVTGLMPNTPYYFRVSSYNKDNPPVTNGQYAYANGGMPVYTKPSAPDPSKKPSVGGNIDVNDLIIEWENEDGTDTKLYLDDELLAVYPKDENPRTDSQRINDLIEVTPDTKYEFYITYENDAGESEPSEKLVVWTDANPAKDLRVTNRTLDSITVEIDPNGNPVGRTQYEYEIYDVNGTLISSIRKTDITHTFTDLDAGLYTISVTTINSMENPNPPAPKVIDTISIQTGTVPPAPTVTTKPTEYSIEVTMIPEYTESVVFRLILKDENDNIVQSTDWAKENEGWAKDGFVYTFTDLQPNKKYNVVAEAKYDE